MFAANSNSATILNSAGKVALEASSGVTRLSNNSGKIIFEADDNTTELFNPNGHLAFEANKTFTRLLNPVGKHIVYANGSATNFFDHNQWLAFSIRSSNVLFQKQTSFNRLATFNDDIKFGKKGQRLYGHTSDPVRGGFRSGHNTLSVFELSIFNGTRIVEFLAEKSNLHEKFSIRNTSFHNIIEHRKGVSTQLFDGNGQSVLAAKNGKLYAEHLLIRPKSEWADYVFADGYELTSLEEVKDYVEENKHLPNVPSAKMIEKEGIDVAEMSRIFMEKIEELTLYTIEQQEQINALKSKLQELDNNN